MATLGGSIFAHNAIKYDYCIEVAIKSLLGVCDEIVALDAESNDGTLELLRTLEAQHSNLRVITGKWDCHVEGQPRYDRLAILANMARRELSTDWHFMLQADEVIHEDSYPFIREMVELNTARSVRNLRLNLYGDHGHYVKTTSKRRPCGDYICRLAKQDIEAIGDAESLQPTSPYITNRSRDIMIFHYGLVRNPFIFVDKVISMQTWFHGAREHVDPRYLKYKEEGKRFDPNEIQFIPKSELTEIPKDHPIVARDWVNERKQFYDIERCK